MIVVRNETLYTFLLNKKGGSVLYGWNYNSELPENDMLTESTNHQYLN